MRMAELLLTIARCMHRQSPGVSQTNACCIALDSRCSTGWAPLACDNLDNRWTVACNHDKHVALEIANNDVASPVDCDTSWSSYQIVSAVARMPSLIAVGHNCVDDEAGAPQYIDHGGMTCQVVGRIGMLVSAEENIRAPCTRHLNGERRRADDDGA